MPLFNTRPYVLQAVKSILNQSHSDLRLLVIDDGSDDSSIEVVQSILDPRIKILSQPHSGPAAAMNLAIKYAISNDYVFIAQMDSDDISHTGRLEKQLEIMMCNPQVAVCSSNCYYIDAETETVIGSSTVPTSPKLIRWEIQHGLRGCIQGASLFRTANLSKVQGYRTKFKTAEEIDLFLRLSEVFDFANSPEYLYNIRLRSDSLSTRNVRENIYYNYYALNCFFRRKRNLKELDFSIYKSSLLFYEKFSVNREELFLYLWRKNIYKKSILNLIIASILDPKRVVARLQRKFNK